MNTYSAVDLSALWIILGLWLVVGFAFLIWYLWAMARLFPRIGLNSSDGWIPIWNQWKLLERAGLPGWVVLLAFVGLGIIPAIMLIVAMHRIGQQYGAGAGYTVLGVFIPPLWATLLANFIANPDPAQAQYGDTEEVSIHDLFAPPAMAAPTAGTEVRNAVPSPQPPQPQQQWAASAGLQQAADPLGAATAAEYDRLAAESFLSEPAIPLGQAAPPAPFSWTAEAHAEQPQLPPPAPSVPPVHPAAAANYAPPAAQLPPVPPVPAAQLPPVPPAPPAPPAPAASVAPPAAPVPQTLVPPPVASILPAPSTESASAAEASASAFAPPAPPTPPNEEAAPHAPTSAAYKPTGITGKVGGFSRDDRDEENASHRAGAHEDELDHTIVAPRRRTTGWVLELPDGTELPLESDTVVGRRPEQIAGSSALVIPDPTRTLSKSHARFFFDGEEWTVEDLGSTNGIALIGNDGIEGELQPGVPSRATGRLLLGTLEVKLRPGGGTA